jgi:hypothetical protein
MPDPETSAIADLQSRIRSRLAELGYPNSVSADNLAHHLAEISVLSRAFSETTLPLFLSMSTDHPEALARLSVSLKCDLEEIRDQISDLNADLLELMQFLNPDTRQ